MRDRVKDRPGGSFPLVEGLRLEESVKERCENCRWWGARTPERNRKGDLVRMCGKTQGEGSMNQGIPRERRSGCRGFEAPPSIPPPTGGGTADGGGLFGEEGKR